jgi:hypothetical protein
MRAKVIDRAILSIVMKNSHDRTGYREWDTSVFGDVLYSADCPEVWHALPRMTENRTGIPDIVSKTGIFDT